MFLDVECLYQESKHRSPGDLFLTLFGGRPGPLRDSLETPPETSLLGRGEF